MNTLELHDRRVDLDADQVLGQEQIHPLTRIEVALLRYLAARPGQAVTRQELLEQVWGYAPSVRSRAVDQTIKRLRPKLEADPAAPRHLITVHGLGYRLDLPAPVDTGLVGRGAAMDALRVLCRAPGVVSVLGSGGVGKTALAQALLRVEGDGVFCPLDAARSEAALIRGIAASAQLTLGADPVASLAEGLQGRLLVLDNLEQAVEASRALISALLTQAPQLRVLVTSRQRLELPGERCLELAPLSRADGVALFEARLRALGVDSAPSRADVGDLVEQVDGLPLAIELAAARARVLSPARILDRLRGQSPVLRDPARGRHQSLASTIAWSWDLLTGPEREALAWCAVFRGRFRLESAEAVLPGPVHTVIDRVQALRDKSLIQEQGGCLFLLSSVRDFAWERLVALGASARAQQAHADHYLQALQPPDPWAMGSQWTLDYPDGAELDNLLAVWERATDPDLAVRCAAALTVALRVQGPPSAALAIADQAVARSRPLPPEGRCLIRARRASLRSERGDTQGALADYQQAFEDARLAKDLRAAMSIRFWQGEVERQLNQHARSIASFEWSLERARVLGRVWEEATCLEALGRSRGIAGELAQAQALLEQSGELYVAAGHRADAGSALRTLGFLLAEWGHTAQASEALSRMDAHWRSVSDPRAELFIGAQAILWALLGDLEQAQVLLERQRVATEQVNNPFFTAEDTLLQGWVHHLAGRLDAAEQSYRDALERLQVHGRAALLHAARAHLAILLAQSQNRGEALELCAELRLFAQGSGLPGALRITRIVEATLAQHKGDPRGAELLAAEEPQLGVRCAMGVRQLWALVGG